MNFMDGFTKRAGFIQQMAQKGRVLENRLKAGGHPRASAAVKKTRTAVSRKVMDYQNKQQSLSHKARKVVGLGTLGVGGTAYAVNKVGKDPEKDYLVKRGEAENFWEGFGKQANLFGKRLNLEGRAQGSATAAPSGGAGISAGSARGFMANAFGRSSTPTPKPPTGGAPSSTAGFMNRGISNFRKAFGR